MRCVIFFLISVRILCFEIYLFDHGNEQPNVNCFASTIVSCIFPVNSKKNVDIKWLSNP